MGRVCNEGCYFIFNSQGGLIRKAIFESLLEKNFFFTKKKHFLTKAVQIEEKRATDEDIPKNTLQTVNAIFKNQ